MSNERIILDLVCKGLVCQLAFNDVALARQAVREHFARSFVLNGWVVDGPNALSLSVGELPPQDDGDPPAPSPSLTLRLRAVPPGGEERVLVDYVWRAAQPLLSTPTSVLDERVDLKPAAQWAWTRATPMAAPSFDDRRAITDLLAGLHSALARRAIDEVVAYQRQSLTEQALAQGAPADAMLKSYETFLRQRMAQADWAVRAVDWSGLRSVPLANGRVHRMTDARGAPPIFTTAGGSPFAIDPCVAKVAGQWVIVR